MPIQFTPAQQRAIDHYGNNLLISAGAGSGKTAVLTERIIRMVEKGVPIDKLVVLTFTNAAAAEMKSRLRKTLMNREKTAAITEAIETIDNAHIRTFDSYTLFLLKTYGHLDNIRPDVRIGDPVEIDAMTDDILNGVLSKYYITASPTFKAYVETFETKDDRTIKNHLRFFHDMLMLSGDFAHQLEQLGPSFYNENTFERLFGLYESFIKTVHTAFIKTLDDLNAFTHYPKVQTYLDALRDTYGAFLRADEYDAMVAALAACESRPRSNAATIELKNHGTPHEAKTFKLLNEQLKALLDKHLSPMLQHPKTLQYEAFMKSSQHIGIVQTLLQDYDEKLMAHQRARGIMHYASVARLAIELLKRHKSLQKTLKTNIEALLVDEYQDTNTLQETLIDLITENNVTMVGDVKQSIYRFRNAEPTLFIKKRARYLSDPSQGKVIDMNENFRSRPEIINDINTVFAALMDRFIGGVDYDDTQQLIAGNKAFSTRKDAQTPYGLNVHLMDEESLKAIKESESLSALEVEIFVIAAMIKGAVGHWKVNADNGLRDAQYRDFALLFEVKTNYDMVEAIFHHVGIPLIIKKDDPFVKYHDVDVARHLLNAVHALSNDEAYYHHFKHAFLGLARSFLYDYSDDAIVRQTLRLPKKRTELLKKHAIDPPFEPLFEVLFDGARNVDNDSVDNLFTALIHKTAFLARAVKLPHTAQVLKRIESLMKTLSTLARDGATLEDVVRYFDHLIQADLDVEFSTAYPEGINAVSMMTIHKSKGLEFPFVIIPHTSRKFNTGNRRAEQFDRSLGIMVDHVDEGRAQAFVHDLKKMREARADISERLRVLYVALTRAEEACIVPLPRRDTALFRRDTQGMVLAFDREYRMKSFADVLQPLLTPLKDAITDVDFSKIPREPDYRAQDSSWRGSRKKGKTKQYETFEFPTKERQKTSFSHGVDALLSHQDYEALTLGNTMHELFESIDFTKTIEPQIKALTADDTERKLLKQFFITDVIQSLEIVEVYKEFPFYMEDEDATSAGYIDLVIETPKDIILIDYKLKHIDYAHYETQVRNYANILKRLTNKPIKGFLYSIIDGVFKPVSLSGKETTYGD